MKLLFAKMLVSFMPVWNQHGATALTRIPAAPHSQARSLVSAAMAPLVELYAALPRPVPTKPPPSADMLMMLPCPRSSMTLPTSRHIQKVP